jgi:hypothetical protein
MKSQIIAVILFSFVYSFFFFNCSGSKTSPVGLDFLKRANIGAESHKVFQAAPNDTFFQAVVHTGSSPYLYFGKYGAIEAKTLILFDTLTVTGSVDSLVLVFKRPKMIAKTAGSVTIRLNVVTKEWNAETVTWSSFDQASIGILVASKTIATDAVSDSAETFEMVLPKEWAALLVDPVTRTAPYGLLVSADPAGGLMRVSAIEVSLNEYEGTPAQLKIYSNQSTSFVSVLHDAFIASMPMPARSGRLLAVNGLAVRSGIRFPLFDIPKTATISRALLTFHEDPSWSFPPIKTPMNLYAFNIKDSVWTLPDVTLDSTYFASSTSSTSATGEATRVFNITSFVQLWVAELLDNNGLVLAGMEESSDLTGAAFYDSQADSLLRPSLDVFYTTPPDAIR